MVNTYGPTEATVIATCADLHPGEPVTIERAVPGYRVLLLDDSLRPVAPGVVGETCIGGIGVARGYVGLTELTGKPSCRTRSQRAATPGREYTALTNSGW
jgi:non-ribosomal peptide synthetase component F